MHFSDPVISSTMMTVIEFLGTFAFAISGIRQAAYRQYDWFGGFICGIAVAIGGGTLRDVMLDVTPFWMTNAFYIIIAAMAQVFVIAFNKYLKPLDNTWLVFDTIGLALFNIVGIQKTLLCGFPFWVAICMGCITGSAGGVIRDVLLNTTPAIFKKDIYAMACVAGGLCYWLMTIVGFGEGITSVITFTVVCLLRFFAVRYNISLPALKSEE